MGTVVPFVNSLPVGLRPAAAAAAAAGGVGSSMNTGVKRAGWRER